MDEAVKAGKISVAANVVLTVLKGVAGTLSGSTALIADAIHSLVDVLGSALVWIGIKIAQKPPDVEHPYGHFKAESLAELGVGIIVIVTAFTIMIDAVNELLSGSKPKFELYALTVAVLSAIVNEALARYKISVGLKTKSSSLIAEGKHSRTDVISSLAVVLGFLLVYLGYWWADAIVAMAISFLILQIGGEILKNAVDVLMDRVDEELSLRIKKIVEGIEGIRSVDFVAVRGTWRSKIVEVHFTVSSEVDAEQIDDIIRRIEGLKDGFPEVVRIVPVVRISKEVRRIAIPVDENDNYVGDLNARFFKIVDLKTGRSWKIKNEFWDAKKMKGYLIADLLSKNGVDMVVVKRIGEGAKNHLKSMGIIIKFVENLDSLDEIRTLLTETEKLI